MVFTRNDIDLYLEVDHKCNGHKALNHEFEHHWLAPNRESHAVWLSTLVWLKQLLVVVDIFQLLEARSEEDLVTCWALEDCTSLRKLAVPKVFCQSVHRIRLDRFVLFKLSDVLQHRVVIKILLREIVLYTLYRGILVKKFVKLFLQLAAHFF